MTTPTSLAELVADRREQLGLSLRQAAEMSGGLISHGRLGEIEAGADANVSDRLLRGISAALDVSLTRVREAAGAPPKDRPFELPERANRLNSRERKLVLNLIDTLLQAHREP